MTRYALRHVATGRYYTPTFDFWSLAALYAIVTLELDAAEFAVEAV